MAILYVGYSSNLAQRILNHNADGTKSTTSRRPLKLFSENFICLRKMPGTRKIPENDCRKEAIKLMWRSRFHTLGYAENVAFIFAEEVEELNDVHFF
jgi:hypothetical protein